jgi:hypothetical protein
MHRRTIALLAIAAVAALAAGIPAPAQDRGRSLFTGRDLTGWDGDPKFWSVRDGALTGQTTAEKPTPANTFLIWKGGKLKDFELRAKWRIQGNNSGIQYRSKDLGNWVVGGYQADIDPENEWTGVFYEERGRGLLGKVGEKVTIGPDGKPTVTGSLGTKAQLLAGVKKGDWNEYLITARGNRITQALNGTVTVEALDEDPVRRAMEGVLAFQLHAGTPMTIQFKDIYLKELPSGG